MANDLSTIVDAVWTAKYLQTYLPHARIDVIGHAICLRAGSKGATISAKLDAPSSLDSARGISEYIDGVITAMIETAQALPDVPRWPLPEISVTLDGDES